MSEYRLHCFAQSGHSYKAALMLALCEADWEPVWVDFFKGATRSEEFRALNVMGECPVLEGPQGTLTQSGVILYALGHRFKRFIPSDMAGNFEVQRWIIWENQKLNGMLGPWRFLKNFAPEKARKPDVIDFLGGRSRAALGTLEAHLSGRDWMVGDAPTIADIGCAGYAFYPQEEYGIDWDDWPAIQSWKLRLQGLHGWSHPYDLMPGHPLEGA